MHDNSELKVQNQDIDKNETIVPELYVSNRSNDI